MVADESDPAWTRPSFSMSNGNGESNIRGGGSSPRTASQTPNHITPSTQSSTLRLQHGNCDPGNHANWQHRHNSAKTRLSRLYRMLILLHAVDGLLAASFFVFHFLVGRKDDDFNFKHIGYVMLFLLSSVLLTRSVSAMTHSKRGWMVSGYTNMLLAIVNFILALIAWCMPRSKLYSTLSRTASIFAKHEVAIFAREKTNPIFIVIAFAGLGVWEIVRWAIIHNYLVQRHGAAEGTETSFAAVGGASHEDYSRESASQSRISAQRRPWWWSKSQPERRDDLEESLLVTNPREGSRRSTNADGSAEATPPVQWFPFLRRSRPQLHDNRDDVSVDFASLNEDWASRSEADPLWWSRDDGAAN
mmetsp:Transcript_7302/g.21441  ORF Transcript_7302/g.21441 Transcript_7302/m.21441 type:complete len:360 (-) Transcript_7302:86-1165(-)